MLISKVKQLCVLYECVPNYEKKLVKKNGATNHAERETQQFSTSQLAHYWCSSILIYISLCTLIVLLSCATYVKCYKSKVRINSYVLYECVPNYLQLKLYEMYTISVQAAIYKSIYSDNLELCYICACHVHQKNRLFAPFHFYQPAQRYSYFQLHSQNCKQRSPAPTWMIASFLVGW